MKLHRVAKLFPEMTTQQLDDLVADIEKNGLIEPILTFKDQIVDGRHRFKACQRLKIEPKFLRWEDIRPNKDASLVGYVISRNLKRRHLTKSQRAAIATKALPLFEAEGKVKQKVAAAKGGKASGETRRQKAPEETKVPADLREPSHSEPSETTKVSEPAPAKKAKTDPKKKAQDRKRESAAKAAEQAGVSTRDVQRAKALGKKSKLLLKMVEDGTVTLVLAEKIAALDPQHMKLVLRDGKRVGYAKALDEFLSQVRPGEGKPLPSTRDLRIKLQQATKQATALNKTLKEASGMAKHLTVEKGPGLAELIGLIQSAHNFATKIASD